MIWNQNSQLLSEFKIILLTFPVGENRSSWEKVMTRGEALPNPFQRTNLRRESNQRSQGAESLSLEVLLYDPSRRIIRLLEHPFIYKHKTNYTILLVMSDTG